MKRSHILGMVCGYFLSRFDVRAYNYLGYSTQSSTHAALGKALGVQPMSIKNWRDEFDPVHDNSRQGWHRRPMSPSRERLLEALVNLTEEELSGLVSAITSNPQSTEADQLFGILEGITNLDPKAIAPTPRGPTGAQAEDVFMKHHETTGEPSPGVLHDRRNDECGFDFEIISNYGHVVVEVKGLAGESGGITFTDKEWRTALKIGDDYFLVLVRNVATKPTISLIQNPGSSLSPYRRVYTTVQIGWTVPLGSINASGS